jgi:putative heme iron utilization protein
MAEPRRKSSLDAILTEAREFHAPFSSLLMATTSPAGEPTASYAPYVSEDGGGFLVYVSELAAHTRNLTRTGRASVLFIEDEREAGQLFARKRVTYACRAAEIPRDAPEFEVSMDRFASRHGDLVALLRGLPDFHLFRLRPERANYVRGFGEAFELDGEALSIRPVNERGHRMG